MQLVRQKVQTLKFGDTERHLKRLNFCKVDNSYTSLKIIIYCKKHNL